MGGKPGKDAALQRQNTLDKLRLLPTAPVATKKAALNYEDLYSTYRGVFPPVNRCLEFLEKMAVGRLVDSLSVASHPDMKEYESFLACLEAQKYNVDADVVTAHSPGVAVFYIKSFLEQREPLTTYERHASLRGAITSIANVSGACSIKADFYDQLFYIQATMVSLPKAHYGTLERVLRCFATLCVRSGDAASTAAKLALMFADALMRPVPIKDFASVPAASLYQIESQRCVQFLIEHYDPIFRQNPIRELNLLFDRGQHLRQHIESTEAELRQANRKRTAMKNHIAAATFAKRIVLRHFMAWRSFTPSAQAKVKRIERYQLLESELTKER